MSSSRVKVQTENRKTLAYIAGQLGRQSKQNNRKRRLRMWEQNTQRRRKRKKQAEREKEKLSKSHGQA